MTSPGPSVAMTRTYSSQTLATKTPVGNGWAWSYGMRLVTSQEHSAQVFVHQEKNGSVTAFTWQPNGTFKAAPRVQATLTRNVYGSWIFTRKKTDIFTFTPSAGSGSTLISTGKASTSPMTTVRVRPL